MKIQQITSQSRFDFMAIMECEHCGNTHRLTTGYDDDFYHAKVIPAMTCTACGKNRAGDVPSAQNPNGTLSVVESEPPQ